MIQLIVGEKGKGKTKYLLDKVNDVSKKADGNIVFLDKNADHMYELKNSIRLINTSDYFITDSKEFVGFISGIISQDNDLEAIYIDRFLKVAHIEDKNVTPVLKKLDEISDQFHVSVIISMSFAEAEIPEEFKSKVIVSL